MSDQLMFTLQSALQQLAIQQTEETLGDPHLRQAWKIRWQEEALEERILEGIRLGYLG